MSYKQQLRICEKIKSCFLVSENFNLLWPIQCSFMSWLQSPLFLRIIIQSMNARIDSRENKNERLDRVVYGFPVFVNKAYKLV